MIPSTPLLSGILARHQTAFRTKQHHTYLGVSDALMDAFGITSALKSTAPQYWGRELGMCWERLVRALFLQLTASYGPAIAHGASEPCDFTVEGLAVDTKYRLGSGDSGTLKKLAANAKLLRALGLEPVMLFLREDSLDTAIRQMQKAGWRVLQGDDSFAFITHHTGADLLGYLRQNHGQFHH